MIIHNDLLDSYQDTAILTGSVRGAFLEFAHLVEQERASTVIVFTGRHSADENGSWYKLMRITRKDYVNIIRFSDIEPEPCIDTVERMAAFLRDEEPGAVMAMGGGSVMDAAKAAYLVYQGGGKVSDYFGINKFSERNPDKQLARVICIPTTAGTGSEATPYSNIVDHQKGVKKLIVEEQIIPKLSFLIPELTTTMSPGLTLTTAMDALAHSLEGFLNVHQDEGSRDANARAVASIELIVKFLPRVLTNGDDFEGRQALAAASCLAGMVIRSKSTGLPHLCSFSWFGRMPHGLAVATLLPYCWVYYLGNPEVVKRTMKLKSLFNAKGGSAESVIKAYCKFIKKCGVELSLKNVRGITKKLLAATAESASQNRIKLDLAPRPVALADAEKTLDKILKNAWEGKL